MKVKYLTRKLNVFSQLPSYTDGSCTLHEVFFTSESFQRKYIKPGLEMNFREKSIYNKTKIEFKQIGIDVVYMIVFPFIELKRDTLYSVVISNEIFEAQNITTVINQNGFKELEFTLSKSSIVLEENLNE